MDMITPNWQPLELFHLSHVKPNGIIMADDHVYKVEMDDFMWMHRNDTIECYKHRITRSYLNIDNHGLFWLYRNGKYHETSKNGALKSLFRLD